MNRDLHSHVPRKTTVVAGCEPRKVFAVSKTSMAVWKDGKERIIIMVRKSDSYMSLVFKLKHCYLIDTVHLMAPTHCLSMLFIISLKGNSFQFLLK